VCINVFLRACSACVRVHMRLGMRIQAHVSARACVHACMCLFASVCMWLPAMLECACVCTSHGGRGSSD